MQGERKAAYDWIESHLGKTKNQAAVYQLLGQLDLQGKNYARGTKHLEAEIPSKRAIANPENLKKIYLVYLQAGTNTTKN